MAQVCHAELRLGGQTAYSLTNSKVYNLSGHDDKNFGRTNEMNKPKGYRN